MRKIKCCKQERESQFCPDCGKHLQDDPLVTLQKYLRHQADKASESLAKREEITEELKKDDDDVDERWLEGKLSRARTHFDKWDSWAKAIEQIIKERQSL